MFEVYLAQLEPVEADDSPMPRCNHGRRHRPAEVWTDANFQLDPRLKLLFSPLKKSKGHYGKNVLGNELEPCGTDPLTGFYRSGGCETGPEDRGVHVVCARVTIAFLQFSQALGNDLITPRLEFGFPGLKPGDRWCLCADRWQEALDAKVAPPVVLAATHEAALQVLSLDDLKAHAAADAQL